MSDSELIVSAPLAGNICPSCARTDAIVRETSIHSLDKIDLIGAWMFGILGILTIMTGRKTVRLRCQHCQCRFCLLYTSGRLVPHVRQHRGRRSRNHTR